MNKVILTGNLTRDPELSATSNGTKVCKFSIAVKRPYGSDSEVDFIQIVAWQQLAEACSKYIGKGSKVLVEGSIYTRSYDAPDGTKRYVTEINAQQVEFLSFKSESDRSEPTRVLQPVDTEYGELPF